MQVARSLIHELLSDECYQELDNDKPKHHLDVSSCISTFALLSVRKNNASVKVLATSFKRSCNRLQENFVRFSRDVCMRVRVAMPALPAAQLFSLPTLDITHQKRAPFWPH